jgi:hypothetical protein
MTDKRHSTPRDPMEMNIGRFIPVVTIAAAQNIPIKSAQAVPKKGIAFMNASACPVTTIPMAIRQTAALPA